MKEFNCIDQSVLPEIASQILEVCESKKIAFYGDLGAGKTTLIKEMCKKLGIDEVVNSPTFTILNEYTGSQKVNHFDFYRIKNKEEIFELGYEEYFYSDDYVFIEWPEKIGDMLPHFFLKIEIQVMNGNSRKFICHC